MSESEAVSVDLFSDFATDTKAEVEGVWDDYRAGIRFLIARQGNDRYNKLIAKLYEVNKRLLDGKGPAAEKKSEEIMIEVLAKTVLLGWEGKFTWPGVDTSAYSVEGAKKMLATKDFRTYVQAKASEVQRFQTAVQEEITGE